MHRPRYAIGFLLAPILFAMVFAAVGCGAGGTEKLTIDRFFGASRMGDNVTLGGIATVAFDPRVEGQVTGSSVVSVSEEQVTPLRLKELAAAYEEARRASEDLNKRKLAYQDQHTEELNRLLDAERKGLKLRGKDAEFQAAWNKWREETAAVEKNLSAARGKLQAERSIAEMSVLNPQNPIDATQYDGELAMKEYTLSAATITPAGQRVTRRLVLTLQQARLKGETPITGRWIITKITDVTASKTP